MNSSAGTFSPSSPKPALGIDFGGTSVKLGVCCGERLLKAYASIVTTEYPGADRMLHRLGKAIDDARDEFSGLEAVGVGMPGFVDRAAGTVHALTNVEGWEGVNVRDVLTNRTGLPVLVENDANAMAYAEWRHGAGRGRRYLLAITLGTGVGGGLILDNALFHGASYGAGEVGQISIDWRGRMGGHGNLGALERYVGNGPFAERACEAYLACGQDRSLDDCDPATIAELAHAGDAVAVRVWDETAKQLAIGLSNVLWVLNLDCIVVGGGMAKAGEVLFKPLRRYLDVQMDAAYTDSLVILPAHFGNEAGMIGAAALASDNLQGERKESHEFSACQ